MIADQRILALQCCLCVAVKDADTVNIGCIDKALHGLPLKRRYSDSDAKSAPRTSQPVSGRNTMISAAAPGIKVPPVTSRWSQGKAQRLKRPQQRNLVLLDEGHGQGQQRIQTGCTRLGRTEWLSFCITINRHMVRGNGVDGAIGNRLDYRLPVIF